MTKQLQLTSSDVALILTVKADEVFRKLQQEEVLLTNFTDRIPSEDKKHVLYQWMDQDTPVVQKAIVDKTLNSIAKNDYKFMRLDNNNHVFEQDGLLESSFNTHAKTFLKSGVEIVSNDKYSLHSEIALVLTEQADEQFKNSDSKEMQDFRNWRCARIINPSHQQVSYQWSEMEEHDIKEILVEDFLSNLPEDQYKLVRLGDDFPDYEETGLLISSFTIYPEMSLSVSR